MSPALREYNHLKDYRSADKALGQKDSKVIGNNTKLVRNVNGSISVTLHGHEIIRYNRGGTISLSSAGYTTDTTKDRLNRYTPSNVSVVQRDFEWYLKRNGSETRFRDGTTINV